jgi:uncharacterized protein YvpB
MVKANGRAPWVGGRHVKRTIGNIANVTVQESANSGFRKNPKTADALLPADPYSLSSNKAPLGKHAVDFTANAVNVTAKDHNTEGAQGHE